MASYRWLMTVRLLPIVIGGCGLVLDTAPSTDAGTVSSDGGLPDGRVTEDSAVAVDSAMPVDSAIVTRDTGPDTAPPPTDGGGPDGWVDPITHYVFVTSVQLKGDFGGLAGADTQCQSLADEAGLGGSFKAILSDSTIGARDRLPLTGRVELVDGTMVAADPDDLWDGSIAAPINQTETGDRLLSGNVWTGTDATGDADAYGGFCGDWFDITGAIGGEAGRTDRVDDGWISIYGLIGDPSHACHNLSHLYCILVE